MKVINTTNAPAAIGPYVQAISSGNLIFVSGQVPLDPKTMEVVGNDIVTQTTQSLSNVRAIIKEAGADLTDVIKCTVYLKDLKDFAKCNEVYAKFFGTHKPARVCCEVSRLPKDALVEIDAIVEKR